MHRKPVDGEQKDDALRKSSLDRNDHQKLKNQRTPSPGRYSVDVKFSRIDNTYSYEHRIEQNADAVSVPKNHVKSTIDPHESILDHVASPTSNPSHAEISTETNFALDEEAILEQRRLKRQALLDQLRQQREQSSCESLPLNVVPPTKPMSIDSRVNISAQPAVEFSNDETQRMSTESTVNDDLDGLLNEKNDIRDVNDCKDDERAQASFFPLLIDDREDVSAIAYEDDNDAERLKRFNTKVGEKKANASTEVDTKIALDKGHEEFVSSSSSDDDDDDMFKQVTLETLERRKRRALEKQNGKGPVMFASSTGRSLSSAAINLETNDDAEGYYLMKIGEILNSRYAVSQLLGKGVFSNVLLARDLHKKDEGSPLVAIKIIRNHDVMYRAGQKEIHILQLLSASDTNDRKCCIRFLNSFEHRQHLCLVFESMSMNLRDVLKKYGAHVGLNLKAVRLYAGQLCIALSLLRQCKVLHADIKPDNILVNDSKTQLKLADFGSASEISENDITPYLVSRFYRAPEIILGLAYDYAIDMWSVGCTLYEIFTGKILFPGRSNNQMLKYFMEVKGKFSSKMLKKGQFVNQYFDENYHFLEKTVDRATGNEITKAMAVPLHPVKGLKVLLLKDISKMKDEEQKMTSLFVDFLERCLELSPELRMTCADALKHPFLTMK